MMGSVSVSAPRRGSVRRSTYGSPTATTRRCTSMQWRNPDLTLARQTIYGLLVSRGLDDWLQPADFFDVARYAGPQSETQYRSEAIGLARRLLRDGHARAGDLVGGEHCPWPGPIEEQVSRITSLWSELDIDPRFVFIWFDLTNSGHEWAEQVLDSLPHIE